VPKVTVTLVSRNFADFVTRVAYRRETFTLVRGNGPLAELRPLPVGSSVLEFPDLVSSLPPLMPTEAEAFLADLHAAGGPADDGRGAGRVGGQESLGASSDVAGQGG
jgi:hypothetical protein